MKSLAALALLAALAAPAAAQVVDSGKDAEKAGDTTELKKKYSVRGRSAAKQAAGVQGDQNGGRSSVGAGKVYDGGAVDSEPASDPGDGKAEGGMRIRDLEALLLKSGGCTVNAEDKKDIADELKNKYGVVNCPDAGEGPRVIVLVPKTKENPAQQLLFNKLKRARYVDHFLVLEFAGEAQYHDLHLMSKSGYKISGWVENNSKAVDFENDDLLADALKNFMGIAKGDEVLTKLPEAVKAAVGSKPHRVTAARVDGKLVAVVKSDGASFPVWPPKDK